jgi:hypothetical protein
VTVRVQVYVPELEVVRGEKTSLAPSVETLPPPPEVATGEPSTSQATAVSTLVFTDGLRVKLHVRVRGSPATRLPVTEMVGVGTGIWTVRVMEELVTDPPREAVQE